MNRWFIKIGLVVITVRSQNWVYIGGGVPIPDRGVKETLLDYLGGTSLASGGLRVLVHVALYCSLIFLRSISGLFMYVMFSLYSQYSAYSRLGSRYYSLLIIQILYLCTSQSKSNGELKF